MSESEEGSREGTIRKARKGCDAILFLNVAGRERSNRRDSSTSKQIVGICRGYIMETTSPGAAEKKEKV